MLKIYKRNNLNTKNVIIFDIGANIGQSTRIFLRYFEDAVIYTFEPSRRIFSKLIKITHPKVHHKNVGIADKIGSLEFNDFIISERSSFKPIYEYTGLKKVLLNKSTKVNKYSMSIDTIDNFMKERDLTYISLCKIDVEGFELEVINGARKNLEQQNIKLLQFEVQDCQLKYESSENIFLLLDELNYNLVGKIKHPTGKYHDYFYLASSFSKTNI
jgi:FkbM family methyltransferase